MGRLVQWLGGYNGSEQRDGEFGMVVVQVELHDMHDELVAPFPICDDMLLCPRLVGILGKQVDGGRFEQLGEPDDVPVLEQHLCGGVELLDIRHDPAMPAQHEKRVVPRERIGTRDPDGLNRAARRMHDLMQVVACGVHVGVGPQRVDNDVTRQRMPGLDGEHLDERLRLAQPPRAGRRRGLVRPDLEPTQQPDLELDRHDTPPFGGV